MRILYITPRYYPHVGGVEYVVKSVAERLAKKGHEVTVLCGGESIDSPKEEWVNEVHVIRWPVWSPGNAYHIPRMRSELKIRILDSVKSYDVVHFHSVHSVLSMYSLNMLRNSSVCKVLTPYYHGTGHTVFRRVLWVGWRSYVRRLLRFVDIIHTVSKLEAQLVKKDFNVDAVPIENGVDEWVLNVGWTPSNYVMYSGRVEKYKNIHRLANIVKILNTKHGFDLELRIYGSGPHLNQVNNYLRKIKIKYSINQPQPFEKYIETLSRASLFGLLSKKESYPQTINEANAVGVPAIVVEPWGLNFSERSRTLITRLDKSDEEIAREVAIFLSEVEKHPKPKVPDWNQIVEVYAKTLYRSQ